VLFSGDTPIVGTLGAILSGSIGSFTGQLQLADGNTDLIVHIPEPGTAALLLAASVALSIRRRRRN